MDCKAFRETLDLYVDDELLPATVPAAHLHEQECASCRRATTSLRNLRRQMKFVAGQYHPPHELIIAVQQISQSRWRVFSERAGISSTPAKTWPAFLRNIPAILSGCVLLLVSVFVFYELNCLSQVRWLRSNNPASTSLIDSRAKEAQRKSLPAKLNQTWVGIDKISPELQRAVIVGEDPNFVRHNGFDYEAIQQAWESEWRNDEPREIVPGEFAPVSELKNARSTISQQLAKNLYLSSRRTVLRKSQEAIITFFLEHSMDKRRILELYLNVVELGDRIYGVEAGAQHYFEKSAASLTPEEAAFLAAIIPNPRTLLNPELNPGLVAQRQRIIRRLMPMAEIP